MLTPAGGKRSASRRLPGMKHGPVGIGFVLFRRELSESARSQSSLRARQVALVPMRLFGSRSLSDRGLGGPSATPGFLLQCADFAAPTVFPIGVAVLQNSIHTTRQGMGDGGLGDVRFLAAAQAVITPRERMGVLNSHVGGGDEGPAPPARSLAGQGSDTCTSPLS